MRKTLLVLGASIYQLNVIRIGVKLGHEVIVTDNIPSNPGHTLAIGSYYIDTTNQEAILELAQQKNITGVISPCTDVAVSTAAYVAESMLLAGVPSNSARILTSKIDFRRFQKSNGFLYPNYAVIDSPEKITDQIPIEDGVLIKPDQSSGSKGIFILDSEKDLHLYFPISKNYSLNSKVLCEEEISGLHGTIEGVLLDGQVETQFVFDRETAKKPYVCTIGHTIPSTFSAETIDLLTNEIERLFFKLNISNTIFDADFIFSDGNIYIIEISPRLGGNSISKLIEYSSGFDIAETAVKMALGESIDSQKNIYIRPTAAILLGVNSTGALKINQQVFDQVDGLEWVLSRELYCQENDDVEPFINGKHCLATIFIEAIDSGQLLKRKTLIREMQFFNVISY